MEKFFTGRLFMLLMFMLCALNCILNILAKDAGNASLQAFCAGMFFVLMLED